MLTPHHDFDKMGVMSRLGGGQNPQQTGAVRVEASSKYNFGYSDRRFSQNQCDGKMNFTLAEPDSWMMVVLNDSVKAKVNWYSLRHGFRNGRYRLRTWLFEGSCDGMNWTTLKEHEDDELLDAAAFSIAGWEVDDSHAGFYSHFRIRQTGGNCQGKHDLCCAGIELYGQLKFH
jgi:hypothetical protein